MRTLLTTLCLLIGYSLLGQENNELAGIYRSIDNFGTIEILKNKYYLNRHSNGLHGGQTTGSSSGTFKIIHEHFIEVNSNKQLDSRLADWEELKTIKSKTVDHDKYMYIKFLNFKDFFNQFTWNLTRDTINKKIVPNKVGDQILIDVYIDYDTFGPYTEPIILSLDENSNDEIVIPVTVPDHYLDTAIFLEIYNKRGTIALNGNVKSGYASLKNGDNKIEITLPKMNYDYFNYLYLKDELMRIKNDTIFWEGQKYVKLKENNEWLKHYKRKLIEKGL